MIVHKFKKMNTPIPLFGGAQGWVYIKPIHFFEFCRVYRQALNNLHWGRLAMIADRLIL
jgi:hypothetical protein